MQWVINYFADCIFCCRIWGVQAFQSAALPVVGREQGVLILLRGVDCAFLASRYLRPYLSIFFLLGQ